MSANLQTQKDPNLIYDVGLHRGHDTDFYPKKGYQGANTEDLGSNGDPGKVRFYRNEDYSLWGSTSDKWESRDAVFRDYRRIFVRYWLFGDYSYLIQTQKGRKFIAQLERILRLSIPGWYDTHARHRTVA